MPPLDSEIPPLSFLDHNSLLNEACWEMIRVARSRGAKNEVIDYLMAEGKATLFAAYNHMRENQPCQQVG